MGPKPTTDPGNWFLRGVQSAFFYYISLTPCIDYKYQRKRRKEARQAEKAQAEVIETQPGRIRQPVAFQTNEQWAEELMLGPGPPKGWEKDTLLKKLKKRGIEIPTNTTSVLDPEHGQEMSEIDTNQSPVTLTGLEGSTTVDLSNSASQELSSDSSRVSTGTIPTTARTHTSDLEQAQSPAVRPTKERRLSSAVVQLKDSLKSTVHPERWNWHRYDREDENLWGISERMSRMWNRATNVNLDDKENLPSGRKRAWTNESDRYDYRRARNPAINDLHPPVVSQLPLNRADAAWMLLPPPSAAVMAGQKRPGAESGQRWPICVMGRPKDNDHRSEKDCGIGNDIRTSQDGNEIEIETHSADNKYGRIRKSISSERSEIGMNGIVNNHMNSRLESIRTPSFPEADMGLSMSNSKPLESWPFHNYLPTQIQ